MKEAYCSFEVSKLLKEKGFNWDCNAIYGRRGEFQRNTDRAFNNGGLHVTSAPTHQMACAWLRERHFIIVVTPVLFNVEYENSKWGYDIWADDNLEVSAEDYSNPLNSYEEATEAALKYVLENLI